MKTRTAFASLMMALVWSWGAQAEGTGILRITTDPGGAKIYVDGKRKGSSPTQLGQSFAVKLPEGEYRVKAILPVDENTEQYGESADAFVGADTIQSLHIELAPRPTEAARAAMVALNARLGTLGPGESFRECPDCPEMAVIPAGNFLMGSPSGEDRREDDEGPQRRVTFPAPFALGRYEVTFAEWDACAYAGICRKVPRGDDGDRGWGRGSRPVINVSWEDAEEYVAWLNSKVGAEVYRLPSEAEWEYAARGGTTTPFWTGGTITTDQANYYGDFTYGNGRKGVFREKTVPVGSLNAPNPFGLHDVHDNVREWVEDCYANSYSSQPVDGRAHTTDECIQRVVRGGSWADPPATLRSASRYGTGPGNRGGVIGFRLARTLTP